jgi:hypothetical protein
MLNSLKMLAGVATTLAMAACATPATGAPLSADARITAAMEGKTANDGTIIKCRSMQVTGTRFPAKECKSEKAWEEFDKLMAENAKSSVDGFQRLNTGCATQAEGTC